MSLQELEEHIPSQTLQINKFVNEPTVFANFVELEDATFRNSIWGNASALAPLEGIDVEADGDGDGDDDGDDDDDDDDDDDGDDDGGEPRPVVKLPETLPNVFGFDTPHILVRSEYEEADEAALKALISNAHAFLVFGQIRDWSAPLTCHNYPQILMLKQENLSFWFGFSFDVFH